MEFLAWAVDILLRGSEESATKSKESLQHSSLQPVVTFTTSIRTALSKGDVMRIAGALDDEIEVCKELGT